jgi:autotransporter translocation and assembly factor TamB
LPLDWALEGEGDMTLVVDGASGQPHWTFDATARAPGTRGHHAESAALALSGAPAELDVRTLNLKVASGSLDASGRVERCARDWPDTLTADGVLRWIEDAGQWQGKLKATSFPLDRVQGLIPKARDWGGRLDATVELGGSPADPRFDVNAEARPFSWRDYHVDNARVRGSFRDGRLAVQQLEVSRGGVQSSASGEMPLR